MASCKKGCKFTRPIFDDSPDQKYTIVDVMQVCGQGMATSANPKLYLVEKRQIGREFLPTAPDSSDLIYGATSSADVSEVTWIDNNNVIIHTNTSKPPKFEKSHRGVNIVWKSNVDEDGMPKSQL